MSESRQTHVTLHDIDPQALEQLVQYSYTAEIVVGEGNVQVRDWAPCRYDTGHRAGKRLGTVQVRHWAWEPPQKVTTVWSQRGEWPS